MHVPTGNFSIAFVDGITGTALKKDNESDSDGDRDSVSDREDDGLEDMISVKRNGTCRL